MKTNAEIDTLERSLNHLRVEFERYFNGALDLPPADLQYQLQVALRDVRGRVRGSIDNFRLNTLEAKFNSYNEMFNRRVRDIEEGRSQRPRSGEAPPRFNLAEGILVSGRIENGAAAALYQGLYTESSAANKVDLDRFRHYLNEQAQKLRQQTGCAQVQFRLANENGKVKLKAKAIRGKGP